MTTRQTAQWLVATALVLGACRGMGAASSPPLTTPSPQDLRREVEALHAAMVAAFKQDPATVGRYYTDDASILGGGARVVGREQVDRYWREGPRGDWTLEVLEVGGDAQSPWVRGRSTIASTSGRRMVTEYVGILRRGTDGRLRFYVDMYVGAGGMVRQPGGAR